jgi:hypothetical protein
MAISVGARYMHLFTPTGPLYQAYRPVGLTYDLAGSRKGTEIRMEPRINPIFPLFYSYYDKNPRRGDRFQRESTPYEKCGCPSTPNSTWTVRGCAPSWEP